MFFSLKKIMKKTLLLYTKYLGFKGHAITDFSNKIGKIEGKKHEKKQIQTIVKPV